MAGYHGLIVNQDNPELSTQLPVFYGGRFHALIPPVVSSPTFVIRIPAKNTLSLSDLCDNNTITMSEYNSLYASLMARKNIIIAGATSSGKTTIANALLKTILDVSPLERFIVIEDNPEILINSENSTKILVNSRFSHRDAVISSLRMRPDRIIIGEIRDGATAIELCKAWRTGHPGGITTIHASSADDVSKRLYNLFQEVVMKPDKTLIESAVEIVVFCEKLMISEGQSVRRVTKFLKT